MWFRSLSELFSGSRSKNPCRKARGANDRRRQARALLFESLDARRVLAFNPFSEVSPASSTANLEVTGDFSGDGQADLVVSIGSGVQVFVATGGGNFAAPVNVALTGNSVAAGDLNGDSKLDLVSGSGIALGNGDGTFQPPIAINLPAMIPPGYDSPVAQLPGSVAVGDINGDGKLDLAVTGRTWAFVYIGGGPYYNTYTSGHVNVLLGNGDGTLQAAIVTDFGKQTWNETASLAPLSDDDGDGDVDDDDNLDLIAQGRDGWSGTYVLRGQGNGSFAPAASVYNYSSVRLVLDDMDEDGFLDLVSHTNTDVRLSRGLPNGTFAPATSIPLGEPPSIPRSVAVGDINGDGKLDIAVTTQRVFMQDYGYYDNPYPYDRVYGTVHTAVKVILGHGNGTFSAPVTSALGTHEGYSHEGAHSSLLGDVNGDGRLDLALHDRSDEALTVALNDGLWAPPAGISIADVEVVEGDDGTTSAVFTVSIVGDHSGVSVGYSTANSSAQAAVDYIATSGTLTFGPGESSQTFSVPVLGDAIDEDDEQFFVFLSNAVGSQITDGQGIGTIEDDDDPPLITLSDVSKAEGGGNTKTTPFIFTVTLSHASSQWVSVNFATADGTATVADNDYYATSGTVWIAPGQTTATITVSVRGDKQKEADERFFVNLTRATSATIDDGQGMGTILNDDGGGSGGKRTSSAAAVDAAINDWMVSGRKKRR